MSSAQHDRKQPVPIPLDPARLFQILDALPAALYVTDEHGRLTYFNQAAVDFSGRVPQVGTDQWCVTWKLYYPDGRPIAHDECPMAVALREGRLVRGVEVIAERPDGTRIPFTPYPVPLRDGTGRIIGGINLLIDISDRTEVRRALRESERRLASLFATVPVGVYTCDAPSGAITYYNDRAAELWGRRPAPGDINERFCGSYRLWLPDGSPLPHDQTPVALALSEGRASANMDVVIERPDGTRIPVLVNIEPIRNDEGRVVGAVNVFQDVSTLKAAQHEAVQRMEQLSTFMETAPVGMHRVGADGTIMWANQAELDLLGYAREEYIGKRIQDFHADADIIADILARLCHDEKLVDYEARLKCKDGSIKTVLIDSNVQWDEGRFAYTQCITRDITERKRAEVLRAGLAAIVDSSSDAIVGKTLDGIINSWNRGAERIFGYTAAEAIGQHITLIIPPALWPEEEEILARLRRGERIEHFEAERVAKDGRRLQISLTVSPIRDSKNRVIGASKIARDITERKLAEAAMREADQRKDEFLAMLAHELRNPLAPLRNSIQILKLGGHRDERLAGQTLNLMERQVGQLVRLIDDLMDVSRISTGKIELKRERTTLRHVLDSAIEIAEPLAKAKWQEILVTVPSDRVVLDADPARLAQLFSNLLNNAIKYSPAGKLVHMTARRMHDEIIVSVEDQGIGISSESLAQVFEPFLQINRSHEGGEPGLGIGLTLVKRLAELHGGSVSAHSEGVNKGSTFVVRLPVLANEPTAGADDAAPSLKSGHRRILIVDDNRDAAESLGRLLELLGHEIHYAHDGVRALETVGEVHPEVVLLDIGLPGLDGYGVCRGIREKEGEPRPFVVAVTGWGQEKDRQRSFDAGFDAHLVKPVEIGKLTELLANGSGPKKRVESVE